MMRGSILFRRMSLAQTAGSWWHIIYTCSCSCFLTDKKAIPHLQFRWETWVAPQRHWPLGHVSYHIRNICHSVNEFIIKAHQMCSFRMRQQSAKKWEKQPPPIKAGMVWPIFTIWEEWERLERKGGEGKERNLGNVTVINYPFSGSQLCLRTGLVCSRGSGGSHAERADIAKWASRHPPSPLLLQAADWPARNPGPPGPRDFSQENGNGLGKKGCTGGMVIVGVTSRSAFAGPPCAQMEINPFFGEVTMSCQELPPLGKARCILNPCWREKQDRLKTAPVPTLIPAVMLHGAWVSNAIICNVGRVCLCCCSLGPRPIPLWIWG